ncbi:MAG: 6-phosphogluconolactonase [Microbacteriaceae bacterium]|nr:6-phosphogluconolactonase [Microbacteriaceae bacterium]
MFQSVEIRRAINAQDVAEQAASEILDRLLKAKGKFHIALTGGTVGILTLKHLAAKEATKTLELRDLHFWFGDERYVETDSPDRNFNQANEAMLSLLKIPTQNIHQFPATDNSDNLDQAREVFEQHIISQFGDVPVAMDLTILGMGPDGHVASLFPGHTHKASLIVAESDSPKPPPQRLSFSMELINASKEIFFVVSGVDKAEVVEKVHKDPECDLPAAKVAGIGQTLWFIDEAAGAAFWSC